LDAPLTFSVVVSTWSEERWAALGRCLASIAGQTRRPHEVIVVVDHNPALLDRVGSTWPDVTAVETRGGRGASSSRNTGASVATGTHVAFLDDDAYASPDWLERIALAYAAEGAVGVGGALEPLWPSQRPWWFPPEFDWVVGCTYPGLPETRSPVRNVISANMSFRRDVLAEVGGERPGFGRVGLDPVACEETELCIRIRRQRPDAEIVYDPDVRVVHEVSEERTTLAYFARRCSAEGRGKALVARLTGARSGLSSEWRYVRRALPLGVARHVAAAWRERDVRLVARATMIVAGLALTSVGFAAERFRPTIDPLAPARR
jgi:GT2 family glycosyltransferase